MENKKRYSIKNILLGVLWVSISAGVAVLLVAGVHKNESERCREVEITIRGVSNNFFVDKADILSSITAITGENPVGKPVGSFKLGLIEKELKKNVWVRNAELFFDNNAVLQVSVYEREPVARIFSTTGISFYIDNDNAMLPLSEKFSARVPVFTDFPSDKAVLTAADSALLNDVRILSIAIQKDSFRMAIIEQVDITPQRAFEMIPKIGNQLIEFGDASDAEEKFRKLELFYKEVMVKAGWSKYSVINVQYKGQVVARRRGVEDVTADSLRTLQIMKMIVNNAEKMAADSLQTMQQDDKRNTVDSSMIQQSIQRDDNQEPANIPVNDEQPVVPVIIKPVVAEKPRMVMPKKPAAPVKKAMQKPTINNKRNDY